jgi:hypothetical protein
MRKRLSKDPIVSGLAERGVDGTISRHTLHFFLLFSSLLIPQWPPRQLPHPKSAYSRVICGSRHCCYTLAQYISFGPEVHLMPKLPMILGKLNHKMNRISAKKIKIIKIKSGSWKAGIKPRRQTSSSKDSALKRTRRSLPTWRF